MKVFEDEDEPPKKLKTDDVSLRELVHSSPFIVPGPEIRVFASSKPKGSSYPFYQFSVRKDLAKSNNSPSSFKMSHIFPLKQSPFDHSKGHSFSFSFKKSKTSSSSVFLPQNAPISAALPRLAWYVDFLEGKCIASKTSSTTSSSSGTASAPDAAQLSSDDKQIYESLQAWYQAHEELTTNPATLRRMLPAMVMFSWISQVVENFKETGKFQLVEILDNCPEEYPTTIPPGVRPPDIDVGEITFLDKIKGKKPSESYLAGGLHFSSMKIYSLKKRLTGHIWSSKNLDDKVVIFEGDYLCISSDMDIFEDFELTYPYSDFFPDRTSTLSPSSVFLLPLRSISAVYRLYSSSPEKWWKTHSGHGDLVLVVNGLVFRQTCFSEYETRHSFQDSVLLRFREKYLKTNEQFYSMLQHRFQQRLSPISFGIMSVKTFDTFGVSIPRFQIDVHTNYGATLTPFNPNDSPNFFANVMFVFSGNRANINRYRLQKVFYVTLSPPILRIYLIGKYNGRWVTVPGSLLAEIDLHADTTDEKKFRSSPKVLRVMLKRSHPYFRSKKLIFRHHRDLSLFNYTPIGTPDHIKSIFSQLKSFTAFRIAMNYVKKRFIYSGVMSYSFSEPCIFQGNDSRVWVVKAKRPYLMFESYEDWSPREVIPIISITKVSTQISSADLADMNSNPFQSGVPSDTESDSDLSEYEDDSDMPSEIAYVVLHFSEPVGSFATQRLVFRFYGSGQKELLSTLKSLGKSVESVGSAQSAANPVVSSSSSNINDADSVPLSPQ